MTQEKQTLSPTERKSVTEYVIELSQRAAQAVSSAQDSQNETADRNVNRRKND